MICRKLDKLSADDTPMVRRGAAMSIPRIANHLTVQEAREFLLPMTKRLLEDTNDSVKIYAVQSSIAVASAVKDAQILRESLLPVFRAGAGNRYSWRLRFAIAENAANLSQYVSKDCVNEEILNLYELLLRDNEPEVRSEAVFKVPIVAQFCDSELLVDKILPIIKEQIASDASQHVKGSMAQAICDLSQCLSKSDTVSYIIPTVMTILKDSATEVRVSLLVNLKKLVSSLEEDDIRSLIIPEVERLSKDTTWRIRLAVINFIPAIPTYVTKETFAEKLEPILLSLLEDSVHGVRMETIKVLTKLKDQYFDL